MYRKSKLRKSDPIPLDPKYKGAKVSRAKIFDDDDDEEDEDEEDDDNSEDDSEDGSEDGDEDEDDFDINSSDIGAEGSDDEIDSDEAFGEDDEGKEYTKFKFSGSRTTEGGRPPKKGDKITGSSDEEDNSEDDNEDDDSEGSEEDQEDFDSDEDNSDEESNSDSGSDSDDAEATRRAELRKLMSQEQTTTIDTLNAAARADIEKGAAVRAQQATFDSLLGARIKLQKALVAVNSLPLVSAPSNPTPEEQLNASNPSWKDAESAAVKLWEALTDMRVNITNAVVPSRPTKRKRADTDDLDAMAAHMSHLDDAVTPWRSSTVDKWAAKTQPTSILPPTAKRLNNTVAPIRASLSSQLNTHLQDMPRLVKRTRVPRAAAPLQSAAAIEKRKTLAHNPNHSSTAVAPTVIEDPQVFDDTDFYQLLLKALVDARMSVASSAGVDGVRWSAAIKASKKAASAVVDTKASKGRKLRYHVHEKLQNFMAREERSLRWEQRQVEDLFAGLLGQRRGGGGRSLLDEEESGEEDGMDVDGKDGEEEEMEVGADGLRLFG